MHGIEVIKEYDWVHYKEKKLLCSLYLASSKQNNVGQEMK